MEKIMAEQNKKIPIYLPLNTLSVKMTGNEYILFNQQITTIITEMCTTGKLTIKTKTEIEIMDDSDPRKAYLQNLVNIVKDKAKIKNVKYNLVSFAKLILEHEVVIEQAYKDNRILNWTAIFTLLADPDFSFDDSSMAEILLKESKRIRDMDKMNGMSK